MDDDLIAAHRDLPALMPYLHLPVQSGSDRILAAMNRRHTRADYLRRHRAAARARGPTSRSRRISSSAFPARPRRISATRCGWSTRSASPAPSRSSTRRGPARRPPTWTIRSPEAVKSERLQRLQSAIERAAGRLQRALRRARRSTSCSRSPAAIRARSSAARPICSRCRSWRRRSMIGEIAPVTITDIEHEQPVRHAGASGAGRRSAISTAACGSLMHCARSDPTTGLAHSPAAEGAATQIVLAFDDNRLASVLFGQYGQNLALIERRLGVVAEQRGNQVTIEGSRDACEQARRVLEGLYEQLKRGDELASGDVEGAIRLAIAQGSLFDYDPATARPSFEEINLRKRPVRARTAAQDAYIRALQAPRAGVRHRPGRHRQDLARGRPRGAAVRAQGGRPHHPVAAGGRGRRAARLPARRHAREGRSLSAADLRRALRPDGCAHRRARAADRRDRDRAARLHARPHAGQCRRHPRRGAEHHRRCR